jgi:hypothetical protein
MGGTRDERLSTSRRCREVDCHPAMCGRLVGSIHDLGWPLQILRAIPALHQELVAQKSREMRCVKVVTLICRGAKPFDHVKAPESRLSNVKNN